MKNQITISDIPGHIFEGEWPGSLAFVPLNCLRRLEETDEVILDRDAYVQSKWPLKNFRANDLQMMGEATFPVMGSEPSLNTPQIRSFIARLENDSSVLHKETPHESPRAVEKNYLPPSLKMQGKYPDKYPDEERLDLI